MKKIGFLLIAFMLATGSAYARRGAVTIVSYVNPEYKGKTVKKVLIRAMNADLIFLDQIERRTETEIEDKSHGGVEVIQFQRLFPPVKEYSLEEIEKVLVEQQIDGVLVFTIGAVEQEISTGWSITFEAEGGRGKSYTVAGRYIHSNIDLYDAITKNILWTAQGAFIVKGGSIKSYKRTSRDMAIKTTAILLKEGFFAKPGLVKKSDNKNNKIEESTE